MGRDELDDLDALGSPQEDAPVSAKTEKNRREAPIRAAELKNERIGREKRHRPLWDTRAEFLREHGMTPRDRFEKDWTEVHAPQKVLDNCRFFWQSDVMHRRRGSVMLPGFNLDIYQPVDDRVAADLGIEVETLDRTPEGWIKVGDAFLMWAPEQVAKEQDKILRRGARVAEQMKGKKAELAEKLGRVDKDTGMIGDFAVASSPKELEELGEQARSSIGAQMREPPQEE